MNYIVITMTNYMISLQKIFVLRSCSETIFNHRTRPCLLYDIKRCSAPCVGYITKQNYNASILDAKKFLEGIILTI